MDFVAIDFETTGCEAGQRNEPWQLGAALVAGGEIVEMREWFFRTRERFRPETPPATFPASEADTSLLDADFLEQWESLAGFLVGRRLVAHNIACERTLLNRLAPLTPWGPWTDTLKVAKARYPHRDSYRLGDLCAALGCVPLIAGRTWHDGLFDAVACARLALAFGVG